MTYACFLVQNYYDLDVRVRRKAEALVAAGYSVDVLALRSSQQPKTYSLGGVNVRGISLGKKRGSLLRYGFEYLWFFVWAAFRLTIQTARKRYVVIDVNTLPDFLIFAGVFARLMGAKLILDMHEITPEFYISKYGIGESSIIIRVLEFIERVSFRFADHVITINEPIQELLASRGLARNKSTVITNGADEQHFTGKPTQSAAADAAASSTKFVMMYHGTLTKLYGLDIAIEAFAIAHKEMPGAQFWILGGGTERTALESQASALGLADRVKFYGMVSPSDIPAWLSKSHVGVLPIRHDVFLDYASPNKLAEYIIMGKPVVISRLRAIEHYFSTDALAFCEPNNPADLARQMVRIFQDQALRERLANKAKQEYAPIRWVVMRERYLRLVGAFSESLSQPLGQSDTALTTINR